MFCVSSSTSFCSSPLSAGRYAPFLITLASEFVQNVLAAIEAAKEQKELANGEDEAQGEAE